MTRRLLFAAIVFAAACATPVAPYPPQAGDRFAPEIAAFAAADAAHAPPACAALFVGSSSIRFWSTLAQDMAPRVVINRGFGGATIADVNRYFEETVARYRPRVIVFYAGENDLSNGARPDEVVEAFRAFMAVKRRALGSTPVYFISVKPSPLRWAQAAAQGDVNQAIAAMAARERDLEFIDVASAMVENGAPRDIFIFDDLHMSAAGYAIWTPIVRAALEPPPPTRAPGCS